ncbi:hypothetical protein CC78DRAFT_574579 [Lojkania enalia]|uniref:Uncharacterized protein n=1 Tax=Lojkania enalia TaxID=147567 RepID=A0A9P4NAX9_9PLEO|nr:hypothetical protein CC78DRAFT_574579 [Didymosphaeria enalia]
MELAAKGAKTGIDACPSLHAVWVRHETGSMWHKESLTESVLVDPAGNVTFQRFCGEDGWCWVDGEARVQNDPAYAWKDDSKVGGAYLAIGDSQKGILPEGPTPQGEAEAGAQVNNPFVGGAQQIA